MEALNIIDKLVKDYVTQNKTENTNSRYKIYIDKDVKIDNDIVREFVSFCLDELKIEDGLLRVVLSNERESFTTFAYYDINKKIAAVYCENRHLLDVFRSLAHELVHYKQDVNDELGDSSQMGNENDGVPIENEANSVAGVIMRKFGRKHAELYK